MIKIYGMETCPHCDYVKKQIEGREDEFEYIDISKNVRYMKEFILLRDSSPFFDKCKERKLIGIPLFVLEDGTLTFKPKDVGLEAYRETEEKPACSLDHKGNC